MRISTGCLYFILSCFLGLTMADTFYLRESFEVLPEAAEIRCMGTCKQPVI